jgi:hypothetical protein
LSATVTVECWGCRKSETHPMVHGEEFEKQREADMAERGWRRRAFGPPSWDKGPWFCSEDCAYNSYNARQAEEYWKEQEDALAQKEFENYCREEADFKFAIMGLLAFLTILAVGAALGDCIHARLP